MFFQAHKALLEKTNSIPGAKVENNKFCLSVHFRCVNEKVTETPCPIFFSLLFLIWITKTKICFLFFFSFGQRWAALAEQVRLVLSAYPKLKLTQGRKVPTLFYLILNLYLKKEICMQQILCIFVMVKVDMLVQTGARDSSNYQMGQRQSP